MRSLLDLMSGDPRVQQQAVRGDVALTEEQFRRLLEGAVPIVAERSLRIAGAVPTVVYDDPGAITSRKIQLVDLADPEVDLDGTGGTFDHLDQAFKDTNVYRIKKNWEIPRLELLAMRRTATYDPLTALGQRIGARIAEYENKFITGKLAKGTKGITTFASNQTFAGASWQTTGNAWKDLTKAVDDVLRNDKLPVNKAALLVNPTDYRNLKQVFTSTAYFQIDQLNDLLPGGIWPTVEVDSGTAWVYINDPISMQFEVFEDLTNIQLPPVDESPRGRLRLSEAFHSFTQVNNAGTTVNGVVSITGIA